MKTSHTEIVFKAESLISDIQDQFNCIYPFLKIEFKSEDTAGVKSPRITSAYRIKDLIKLPTVTKINIDKNRTIEEVANDCIHKLGLPIQVLRKSGNVWSRISLTDGWTLESQNSAGQFISSEMTRVSTLPIQAS